MRRKTVNLLLKYLFYHPMEKRFLYCEKKEEGTIQMDFSSGDTGFKTIS